MEQKQIDCFNIFSHVSVKGVVNKRVATYPQVTTLCRQTTTSIYNESNRSPYQAT